MSDSEPAMAPSQFVEAIPDVERPPADFSSDEGALAYAMSEVDALYGAMRFAIEKQIVGWPADDRELNTYEAIRHLIRSISIAHSVYMEADYENPNLTKLQSTHRGQFQLPSPDCVYHSALLHGDYRYRLRGNRGSAAAFQTTVYAGHACDLVGWQSYGKGDNFDTPAYAPMADIDVVLSKTKPADLGDAHWLEMPDGPCELQVRQYYADWENEQPAELYLTKEDQTFPAKLLTRETSERRFKRLTDLLRIHANYYRMGVQTSLNADPHEIGELVIPGAFEGTRYFNGHFRCKPDEAIIIEFDDAASPYWNISLYQLQWEAGDWWARQSSSNISQAKVDSDGRIRFVASWQEPEAMNWLDCSGRTLSLISFRFFKAQRDPSKPRLTIVPFAELKDHLPADTVTITPEERSQMLKRRLASVTRRRANDY